MNFTAAEEPGTRPVDLNDYLSADNVWTARLLGIEPFQQQRTLELIGREYDEGFYGRLLEQYRNDPDALRRRVLDPPTDEIVASFGDRLFFLPLRRFHAIKRDTIRAALHRFGGDAPRCELGAGYGSNFLWQDIALYGGEYSPKARELAALLGHEVHRFNFFETGSYEFIRPGTVVYTCHGIEQVPDARPVLEGLKSVRDRIECVVHFEPLHGPHRRDLLGLLRNRWGEINDYNRNLIACLEEDPDVEVLHLEPDVFGNNPLNPAGILVWRFAS